MASTGSLLRELREQRGVSLEDVARSTRINPRFLAALETDDLAALPAGPFARGFIRAYCEALGASSDAVLAQYPRMSTDPGSLPRPPSGRRRVPLGGASPLLVSLALFVGLGLALAAVTLALRPTRDEALPRSVPPRSHAGSAAAYTAEAVVPGPLGEARTSSVATGATVEPAPPRLVPSTDQAASAAAPRTPQAALSPSRPSTASKVKSYRLVARTSQATRIRVRLDGRRTVEETIPAGAVREWISSRPFELRIVNAGGVTLELNGRVLPPLGARGTTIHHLVLPTEPR
jgi:cytoskeletal protein RodZ